MLNLFLPIPIFSSLSLSLLAGATFSLTSSFVSSSCETAAVKVAANALGSAIIALAYSNSVHVTINVIQSSPVQLL